MKIIKYLNKQTFCFTGDLPDVILLAQSTVSQHLKELKNAGLIEGKVNPPKIKYCINREKWEKAKSLFCIFFDINLDDKSCMI